MPDSFNIKHIKKNVAVFLVLFASLYVLSFFIDGAYTRLFINSGNSWFRENINNDYNLSRKVRINQLPGKENVLQARITFFDNKDQMGNFKVKTITTNMRREGLVSTIFLISLIFTFPLRLYSNLIKFAIGMLLIHSYIFFKLYVFMFDNFNDPNLTLKKLSEPLSSIVYHSNYFFNVTGSSTVVIIPVFIWMLLNINYIRKRI